MDKIQTDTNNINIINKRFEKNDAGFICVNCGKEVAPLGYTSRNHCPRCLCSLHVDIMPGDRSNACGGILEPLLSIPGANSKKNIKSGGYNNGCIVYTIEFRCGKCGERTKNKSAADDDAGLLIRLTNPENNMQSKL